MIICAIVIVTCFIINKAFDIASDKVESMSQEEKEAMDDKWDVFIDWLNN